MAPTTTYPWRRRNRGAAAIGGAGSTRKGVFESSSSSSSGTNGAGGGSDDEEDSSGAEHVETEANKRRRVLAASGAAHAMGGTASRPEAPPPPPPPPPDPAPGDEGGWKARVTTARASGDRRNEGIACVEVARAKACLGRTARQCRRDNAPSVETLHRAKRYAEKGFNVLKSAGHLHEALDAFDTIVAIYRDVERAASPAAPSACIPHHFLYQSTAGLGVAPLASTPHGIPPWAEAARTLARLCANSGLPLAERLGDAAASARIAAACCGATLRSSGCRLATFVCPYSAPPSISSPGNAPGPPLGLALGAGAPGPAAAAAAPSLRAHARLAARCLAAFPSPPPSLPSPASSPFPSLLSRERVGLARCEVLLWVADVSTAYAGSVAGGPRREAAIARDDAANAVAAARSALNAWGKGKGKGGEEGEGGGEGEGGEGG